MNTLFLTAHFLILALLEKKYRLRNDPDLNRNKRWRINFSVLICTSSLSLFVSILLQKVPFHRSTIHGLMQFAFPEETSKVFLTIVKIVILDLCLYWWHRANHELPILWRFHQFHHLDTFMDASTAVRFHPVEILFSIFLRLLFATLLGISLEALLIFQLLVTACALFHHANLRLPMRLGKALSCVFVTPLHHQNHHSFYLSETDSNYGTIFSFWDRIFNSFTAYNFPNQMNIGVPTHPEALSLGFFAQLLLPFQKIQSWPLVWLKRMSQ